MHLSPPEVREADTGEVFVDGSVDTEARRPLGAGSSSDDNPSHPDPGVWASRETPISGLDRRAWAWAWACERESSIWDAPVQESRLRPSVKVERDPREEGPERETSGDPIPPVSRVLVRRRHQR